MPRIQSGQKIGEWDSNFGKADITAKKKLGNQYPSQIEAHKAIVKSGEQGAIVKNEKGGYSAYTVDDGANFDDLDAGETFKVSAQGKAKGVVDFVGDDGASLTSGTIVKAPNKKTDRDLNVYFTRTFHEKGLKGAHEKMYTAPTKWMQGDEMSRLQDMGYTVILDNTATKADMQNALYDPKTAGWVNFGHGGAGGLSTYEDDFLFPNQWDVDPKKVSKNLKMSYMQSCQVGELHDQWQKALGPDVKIYDWDRSVSNFELWMVNGGNDFSFGSMFDIGLNPVVNPYAWRGETLGQAITDNLK